jgi:hypothetical protein
MPELWEQELARAQLVQLEVNRLAAEASVCSDLNRLAAIRAEMGVLHASMLEIRREQLRRQIEGDPPAAKKRSWWRRLRRVPVLPHERGDE